MPGVEESARPASAARFRRPPATERDGTNDLLVAAGVGVVEGADVDRHPEGILGVLISVAWLGPLLTAVVVGMRSKSLMCVVSGTAMMVGKVEGSGGKGVG